jgi:hypothetical protein
MSGLFKRPVEEPVAAPEATKGLMQQQSTEDDLTVQALLKALAEYEARPLK